MPNQQPSPSATTNPHTATDGTQLDPTALTLAKSIRAQEVGIAPDQNPSVQDYSKMGDSGKSSGIAQWLNGDSLADAKPLQPGQVPINFQNDAKQYGLDPTDFSPKNQDKVLYARIEGELKQGLAPSEIAAKQNGAKLVNGKYVALSPEYAAAIQKNYTQLAQGTQPPQNAPTNPAAPAVAEAAGPTPAPQSLGQQALGVAGKVGDFFFPAVKDVYNDVTGKNSGTDYKTPLQQVGDVGMSALSLVPGIGEAGDLVKGGALLAKGAEGADLAASAAKAAKVGGEISQASKAVPAVVQGAKSAGLISKIGKDAALGYGMDVSQKLGQGNTNAQSVLTPGLGTLTGGALGAGGALLDKVGDSVGARVVNSLIKPLKKDFSYGKNPGRAVAEEGIVGNSLDDLASNIGTRRREIGQQISQIGGSVPNLKINLNKVEQYDPLTKDNVTASVLKPIDDALEQAARTNNPAMFTRLQQTKKALTEELGMGTSKKGPIIISKGVRNFNNMGYKGAQELKQHIGDMTQWTGNPSDDKTINAALKSVWSNIAGAQKKGLESVNPALRTQLEKLNERYGDLTSAEVATKYREAIHGRQNLISLGDKLSAGAGLMTGLLTGTGPIGGGVGAAAMAGVSHLLGTTAAKTRIARALAKTSGKKFPGFITTAATRTAASQN